jgi:hypothetical protein
MKSGRIAAAVRWVAALGVAWTAAGAVAAEPPRGEDEPPRILSLLEHAWAAESGGGDAPDRRLALALYCRAGLAGSPEGYFRVGLLLVDGPPEVRDVEKGRGYLALAAQLGHERAAALLDEEPALERAGDDCAAFAPAPRSRFGKRFRPGADKPKPHGARCGRPPARTPPTLRAPAA